MYGIMVFALEERHLEGKNREQLVDIALNVFDAPLFPCPYFGRDVIVNRNVGVSTQIAGYAEVEARIVDQDYHIGLPCSDVAFAHLHVAQYGAQVQQHWHKAHVGQLAIVFYAGAAHSLHKVATEETKLGIGIMSDQGSHQSRGV